MLFTWPHWRVNKNSALRRYFVLCGQRESVTSRSFQSRSRPRLADKPSLRSSCIPAPSFDSFWLATKCNSRKATLYGWHSVRPEGIEPSTNPWQGLIIPLNHGRNINLVLFAEALPNVATFALKLCCRL